MQCQILFKAKFHFICIEESEEIPLLQTFTYRLMMEWVKPYEMKWTSSKFLGGGW